MRNWDGMLAARTRHGAFRGRGREDETAYYDFFSGAETGAPGASAKLIAPLSKLLRFATGLVRLVLPDGGPHANMPRRL